MDRVDSIYQNEKFLNMIKKMEVLEADRKFCKHGIEHVMDVARIAYIINLEEDIGIKKDVLYAAALLHDLGRISEYEDGTSHDVAGINIAKELLKETAYNDDEIAMILEAISNHRGQELCDEAKSLANILKRGDKNSRMCLCCKAYGECKWDEDKKNKSIIF